VVLESLACGTPVLATSVGGIPEILTSSNVGILVERKSEQVAKGLSASFECSWSKSEILNYGQQFHLSHTADALREVFQSVVPNQETANGMPFPSGL
jgi:glycosyltransferase involved in cell wall biosynthesis